MAKNFPYFKFTVTEWMTGDIVYERLDVQGLFINICALYWQRDGVLSIDDINKRFKNPDQLSQLTDRFISVNDRFISVNFLDEQLEEARHISKTNSKNGSLGGRPKANKTLDKKPNANRTLTELKAKKSKEEEELNKNKNKPLPLELNFDFMDDRFTVAMDDFLKHRIAIGKPIERQQSLEATYKGLVRLSKNESKIAEQIVEQSIANNWQGLFELKGEDRKVKQEKIIERPIGKKVL